MTKLGEQTAKFALTLVAAAYLLQWTWQLLKPLAPVFRTGCRHLGSGANRKDTATGLVNQPVSETVSSVL